MRMPNEREYQRGGQIPRFGFWPFAGLIALFLLVVGLGAYAVASL